jgi:hypothetical protein
LKTKTKELLWGVTAVALGILAFVMLIGFMQYRDYEEPKITYNDDYNK